MNCRSPVSNTNHWTPGGRCAVFALGASSIACLLAEFYGLCSMRRFTVFVFLPALVVLTGLAAWDRLRGDAQLFRAVLHGLVAGLIAAVAYDLFRLPFVFAREWGIQSIVPPMNLFKVFPRFGAMILGEALQQDTYSRAAHLVGWAYHFSNGATFGVMYLALVGTPSTRHWCWAVLFAVVLELGMLFTPYPAVFNIPVTGRFVLITVAAHAVFGVGLGVCARHLANRRRPARFPQSEPA